MPFLNKLVDYNPIAIAFNKLFEKFPLINDLGTYFSDLLLHNSPKNVNNMFFAIGVLALTYKVCHKIYSLTRRWSWLIPHFHNERKDTILKLQTNYGKCWALVTGFTKGIGWGMAIQLAECGYNLLLLGRDQQLIKKRLQYLQKTYPGQQFKTIICDALKQEDVQRMKEELKNYAQKLDIGIVFNNLGNVCGGDFWTVDKKALLHVLQVNMHFTIMMSQLMLPYLRKRQKRSAMMTVSSCTGIYSAPFIGCYPAIKNLLNIYTQSIAKQNIDKIDILSVTPFGVSTKMMSMKKGPFMVSPEQCSAAILNDLGHSNHTFGQFKHKLSSAMIEGMNDREICLMYKSLRPPHLQ